MAEKIKKNEESPNIDTNNIIGEIVEDNIKKVDNIKVAKQKSNKNEVDELKAENKRLKGELESQSNSFDVQLNAIKAQMDLLMKAQMTNVAVTKEEEPEAKEIIIGCRAFSGAALASNDGTIVYTFNGGEEKGIDSEDLRQVLRENGQRNNKKLFQNGLFYFVDEKYYNIFKIKKNVDLSKEHIAEIVLTKDKDEMIRKVKEMTNDKSDMGVTHTFKFLIAEMLLDEKNPLASWTYDNKKYLETYLGNNFDDLIASSGIFKYLSSLGRRK